MSVCARGCVCVSVCGRVHWHKFNGAVEVSVMHMSTCMHVIST